MIISCWFFEFEGEFLDTAPVNFNKGLFSSCLVPRGDYNSAEELFLIALEKSQIKLLKIIDSFVLNEETMDINSEANRFWIDWFEETILTMEVSFDQMYFYPKGDVSN